ncbi:MAG: trehalose utilization protein [Opitutales bacterium TMED158]|nr:MAG: trehalose utilization protein [Opitutales bacterium TMED158]
MKAAATLSTWLLLTCCLFVEAEPVHVLMWDERQPRQAEAYDNFLGNEIVKRLRASSSGLEFRSVALDDPEQGLSDDNLNWADVIIWWGHARQWEISPETAQRKLLKRIMAGELDLIALHSAHWATVFMEAMNERTRRDARKRFPQTDPKFEVEYEYIPAPGRMPPSSDSLVTPAYYALRKGKRLAHVRVDMPNCCFPAFRPDGEPGDLSVVAPNHPIAKGLPNRFEVKATEMYNEPFHVPDPDQVIFEERWRPGEWFRSGMVWNLGKGKVFYFRPGHETFPVFKQPEIIQILANACHWLGEE